MKKRNKSKHLDSGGQVNPVAKYARQFNKAQVFQDRTQYKRNRKHKGQEPFPMLLRNIIGKGFLPVGNRLSVNEYRTLFIVD